ncbi:alpha-ribazole transporter [Alkalibaculum bacchi]|uniref:Alpha-ribazole transporter n=1 Tax=Alkalibaculum bacchi TaxID=645887 RepID=A0A366I1W7_9FIRM|nr:ECF transporter S component [Alkalibaculum bacchi]RBP61370.1 alpha-ribazole transporter [Alkalibaculum bacchi]
MNSLIQNTQVTKTRKLVYTALLIALAFIGAQIKILGSIALDALPAFFAALLLGPVAGAAVGAIGHLLTAMTSGFPMSIPIHLVVMCTMAFICWLYGYLNNRINLIVNSTIAIILNGVGATYLSVLIMQLLGMIPTVKEFFFMLVGPLLLASTVNVLAAAVLYSLLKKRI